jgi:hypothetical protein
MTSLFASPALGRERNHFYGNRDSAIYTQPNLSITSYLEKNASQSPRKENMPHMNQKRAQQQSPGCVHLRTPERNATYDRTKFSACP